MHFKVSFTTIISFFIKTKYSNTLLRSVVRRHIYVYPRLLEVIYSYSFILIFSLLLSLSLSLQLKPGTLLDALDKIVIKTDTNTVPDFGEFIG